MSAVTSHSDESQAMTSSHSSTASVALDIGSDRGALIILPAARFDGREIEISRMQGDGHRVHTGVHRRRSAAGEQLTAIFGSLARGRVRHLGGPGPAGRRGDRAGGPGGRDLTVLIRRGGAARPARQAAPTPLRTLNLQPLRRRNMRIQAVTPRAARRAWGNLRPEERRSLVGMAAVVIALHAIGFFILFALVAPRHLHLGGGGTFTVGLGLTAYTLGLRHAFDADHIAAIDNTTRKLMADGQRPLSVGFFFSLGHSSVVFALSLLFAVGFRALSGPVAHGGSALHSVDQPDRHRRLRRVPAHHRRRQPRDPARDRAHVR